MKQCALEETIEFTWFVCSKTNNQNTCNDRYDYKKQKSANQPLNS